MGRVNGWKKAGGIIQEKSNEGKKHSEWVEREKNYNLRSNVSAEREWGACVGVGSVLGVELVVGDRGQKHDQTNALPAPFFLQLDL